MHKYKVVNTDVSFHPVRKEDVERLRMVDAELTGRDCKSEDAVISFAKDADAIVFAQAPITKKVINALGKCKIIVRYGSGMDSIDTKAATEKGIAVSYVPEFCTEEVSNHAFMLLLACSRRLKILDRLLSDKGEWSYDFGHIGGIQDETLGLIGFGKIAKTLTRKAKCFGMSILVYDPYVSTEIFEETGVTPVSLQRLLKDSDYISLHAPLTDTTRHLIGEKELKLVKKTAIIINTARGKLIDEKALISALQKKSLLGAGLDVFEKEPAEPENALLHMDNVIVTPHCASYSKNSYNKLRTIVIDEVVRVFQGKSPKNWYNPEVKRCGG